MEQISQEVIALANKLATMHSEELESYKASARKSGRVKPSHISNREIASSLVLQYFSDYITYLKCEKKRDLYNKLASKLPLTRYNQFWIRVMYTSCRSKFPYRTNIDNNPFYVFNGTNINFFLSFLTKMYAKYSKTFISDKAVCLYLAKLFIDSKIDADNLTRRL